MDKNPVETRLHPIFPKSWYKSAIFSTGTCLFFWHASRISMVAAIFEAWVGSYPASHSLASNSTSSLPVHRLEACLIGSVLRRECASASARAFSMRRFMLVGNSARAVNWSSMKCLKATRGESGWTCTSSRALLCELWLSCSGAGDAIGRLASMSGLCCCASLLTCRESPGENQEVHEDFRPSSPFAMMIEVGGGGKKKGVCCHGSGRLSIIYQWRAASKAGQSGESCKMREGAVPCAPLCTLNLELMRKTSITLKIHVFTTISGCCHCLTLSKEWSSSGLFLGALAPADFQQPQI